MSSRRHRHLQAAPETVWEVLSDGWLFPVWVVGASRMREVDDHWPEPGARLHHSVGAWPVLLDDETEVLESVPGSLLVLRARVRPWGEADVRISIGPVGATSEVTIEEDVVSGPGTLVPAPTETPGARLAQHRDPSAPRVHRRASTLGVDPATGAGAVTDTWDAVVVGSGPNGLVAANRLADRGWSVLVLEAQATYGGAVRSDSDLHDDFVHDTFSAFYPLGVASPALTSLGLEEHGLVWEHAPAVLGHVFGDGEWALLHRDREVTSRSLGDEDGTTWLRLCELWDDIGPDLVGSILAPFPPVRSGSRLAARVTRSGGLGTVRMLLTPALDLAETRFRERSARALLMGNAGHSDIPLTAPGSGLLGLLMSMLGQTVGFPAPRGGAARLSDALVSRLRSCGGEVRCGQEVTRVVLHGGRAVGVRVGGAEIRATRAILADTSATSLYGDLVPAEELPARVVRGMRDFRLDPGTVKVDWALSAPVPWAVAPAHAPGTVHVAESPERLAEALGQVTAGVVPAAPFLLAGQMTTTDASRSPAGTESLWAYTHVPHRVEGDAGGGIRGVWDRDECERFADRMQSQLERVAPGFSSRVLARRVLGPRELEQRDANLVGGSIGGGTSQLHQQLVFRPVPGWGRAETGIPGLFLCSSAAHPGGGVHGAAGMNAARAALAHDRWSALRRRR